MTTDNKMPKLVHCLGLVGSFGLVGPFGSFGSFGPVRPFGSFGPVRPFGPAGLDPRRPWNEKRHLGPSLPKSSF